MAPPAPLLTVAVPRIDRIRIYIATGHAGLEFSHALQAHLRQAGDEVVDHGPTSLDPEDDYPAFCINAALATGRSASSASASCLVVRVHPNHLTRSRSYAGRSHVIADGGPRYLSHLSHDERINLHSRDKVHRPDDITIAILDRQRESCTVTTGTPKPSKVKAPKTCAAAQAGAVLIGLGANAAFGAGWLDPLIALGLAGWAIREGIEAGTATTAANPSARGQRLGGRPSGVQGEPDEDDGADPAQGRDAEVAQQSLAAEHRDGGDGPLDRLARSLPHAGRHEGRG